MRRIALIAILALGSLVGCAGKPEIPATNSLTNLGPVSPSSELPVWHPDYQTSVSLSYYAGDPEADELKDVQAPIPMKDRVKNYTGIQCVFSSLECLGRWAECKPLVDPPMTSRADCKSYSGPSDAASKLRKLGVKFEDSYRDRAKGIQLIKKAMAEGRGCLWGVPGHAMVLCHYDEAKDTVKWIDNSDRSLRVQTTTVAKFNQRWDSWVVIVYAEPDVIPTKLGRSNLPNLIPIIDRNGIKKELPKDYIPIPSPN